MRPTSDKNICIIQIFLLSFSISSIILTIFQYNNITEEYRRMVEDEDIDKLIDDVDIQLETEKTENTPKDGVVDETPVDEEKPKKNTIEKPKRKKTEAQQKAWEKALATRRANVAKRKAEKEAKELEKSKKKPKPKKKEPSPPPSEDEESEYEEVDEEVEESEESEEEEVVVVKKKAKPKAKPKPKKKVKYVYEDSDSEEEVVEEVVEEKPKDPYEHLDFRTRARLRGF